MKKLALLAASALLLAACGKDNKDPIANAQEAREMPELQGSFQARCDDQPLQGLLTGIFTGLEASPKSSRTEFKFEGANVTRNIFVYSELNCEGAELYTFRETGEFNVSENQKTQEGATIIDLEYEKLFVKIGGQEGVVAANGQTLCGAQNWQADEDREVTGLAQNPDCYGIPVPRKNLNIVRVDNNTLVLGSDTNENDQPRPEKLQVGDYDQYIKQ